MHATSLSLPVRCALASFLAVFSLGAEIANVATRGTPSANAPMWGPFNIRQLNNGALGDVFHGDTAIPTGFAYTLDLGKPYVVNHLQLWPRQDGCCPERFSNLRVSLHSDDGAGNIGAELWRTDLFTDGTNPGSTLGTVVMTGPTNPVTARWVKIESLADPVPDYALQMTELGVYADVPETDVNRALGAIATATGPLSAGRIPANLVDGNLDSLVSAGPSSAEGFGYLVNLGAEATLNRIVIRARQDGISPELLSNYRVSLHADSNGLPGQAVWTADLHTDMSYPAPETGNQDELTASLDPAGVFKGQWIRISSLDNPVVENSLQIAELEAYGTLAEGLNLLISQQPIDLSAGIGQSASFAVGAKIVNGDEANLSYQWQHDGTNIAGATNATFIISSVQTINAGSYRAVVAYPGVPSQTTDAANLRINYAYHAVAHANQPIYASWPVDWAVDGARNNQIHGIDVVEPGFAYTFDLGVPISFDQIAIFPRQDTCCPERLSNFRLSIHRDNQGALGEMVWKADLFTDGSNPGSGPGTLVTVTGTNDPAGQFQGQWIKLESLDAAPPSYALQIAELEAYGTLVNTQPQILIRRQPAEFTTAPGLSAEFSVDIDVLNGDANLATYQWQRNTVDIPGATRTNYVIPTLTDADANSLYRVIITYPGIDPVVSSEALLAYDYNYARGAAAYSNQPIWGGWPVSNLTDGRYSSDSLVHGDSGLSPGFAYTINLGRIVEITNIVIWARQDGAEPNRLSNFRVSVHADDNGQVGAANWSADMRTDGVSAGSGPGIKDVLDAGLDAEGEFTGQWIRIASLDDPVPDYALQINEVQVIGRALAPFALTVGWEAGNLVLTWPSGSLEASADLQTWNPVANATSPYQVQPVATLMFYRLRQ